MMFHILFLFILAKIYYLCCIQQISGVFRQIFPGTQKTFHIIAPIKQ